MTMIGAARNSGWGVVGRRMTDGGSRGGRVGVEVRQTIWTKRTARPSEAARPSARPSSEDGGRPETMMRMLQARYPGMTASQLPSLTAAFVLLHELTALVPMVVIFGIVQVTGTGARLVQAIRDALPPSPPSPQDPHQHPAPSENTSLAASLSAAIDNSALKVSKIAHKYGYDSAEDDAGEDDDEGKSMLDNGVLASGLVAYLAVKMLLPFRVSLSLYLTPGLARQIRRMANYQPKKPSP